MSTDRRPVRYVVSIGAGHSVGFTSLDEARQMIRLLIDRGVDCQLFAFDRSGRMAEISSHTGRGGTGGRRFEVITRSFDPSKIEDGGDDA